MDRRTAITGAGSGIGQVVVRLCGRGRTALRDASDAIHVIAPVRHDAIRRMLLCLTLLLTAALPAQAQQRVLNVYNWTDYIDPTALKRFEKEISAKVNYDEFDSLETLEAKMLAGHSGYDIVVPSDEPSFSRLIKAGALAPIDHADIPNWKNLDPALMRRVAASDPRNAHGAIYLYGSTGLGIKPDQHPSAGARRAARQLGPAVQTGNMRGGCASCGIVMLDSEIDVIPTVLRYLGKSPDSTDAADLAAVEQMLMAIRPYIRNFASGGALEALAAGEVCLAMDYSGDVAQAAARAAEAHRGVTVRYVDSEGRRADRLRHAGDSRGRAAQGAALQFINFLLQPDVMAGITNVMRYPNAVPASRADDPAGAAGRPGSLSDTGGRWRRCSRSVRCRSPPNALGRACGRA